MALVGISGEVVSDYIPLVEQALGSEHLWFAGETEDVIIAELRKMAQQADRDLPQ